MFGVGFSEILMIIFVAFIFIGPKRAVEASYELGVWIRKIRTTLYNAKQSQIPDWDASPLYQAKVELNKSLGDLNSFPKQSQDDPS